jgi:hypothetical protein
MHLPSSPSRLQALNEFEPILLENFQRCTKEVDPEVRDAMHYELFSTKDRFCVSAAWLIAPRIGVSTKRFALTACALETLRCSLELSHKLRSLAFGNSQMSMIEPILAEAAAYGLIPLAFEMILAPIDGTALSDRERAIAATALARAASPVHVLSAIHREEKILATGFRRGLSQHELLALYHDKVTPAFQAIGELLEIFTTEKIPSGQLASWFKKLGLFAHWVDESTSDDAKSLGMTKKAISLNELFSPPQIMDLIKTTEVELLEQARELRIQDVAHELIEPLADVFRNRLS